MRPALAPGITGSFSYLVPESKTVRHVFEEAAEFQTMPHVLATAFLVGLVEWTCVRALVPFLDAPSEQTVGTDVNVTHSAATPPGMTVTVDVLLEQVEGRRLVFSVVARDGVDEIRRGTHERYLIDAQRFNERVARKRERSAR